MKTLLFCLMLVSMTPKQLHGQQADAEKLLVDYYNKYLSGTSFESGINYPKTTSQIHARMDLAFNIGKDIALVFSFGGSEVKVKCVELGSMVAQLGLEVVKREGDIPGAAQKVVTDKLVDLVMDKSGKYIVKEMTGATIGDISPIVRTGISLIGFYSAEKKAAEHILADVNKYNELLYYVGETAGDIIQIMDKIDLETDSKKKKELSGMLSTMVHRSAELTVYKQMVANNARNDFGRDLDYAIDNIIPGRAHGTINARLVQQTNDYISGKITEAHFMEILQSDIASRSGVFSPDKVMDQLQNTLNDIRDQREKMTRYGGVADLVKMDNYKQINDHIPIWYKVMASNDLTSVPIELSDHFKQNPPATGTFVPEFATITNNNGYITPNRSSINIKSAYKAPTLDQVQKILNTYKSIPGGITMEGTLHGVGSIEELHYLEERNLFVINNEYVYHCPVRIIEMKDIFRAINHDSMLGVSLGSLGFEIIYGELQEISTVAVHLKMADYFLGQIVWGNTDGWLRHYNFADGYIPVKNQTMTSASSFAVYFNFSNYRLTQEGSQLVSDGFSFDATLVPLSRQKGADGGHLPDLEAVKNKQVSEEHEQNIFHITSNFNYYLNEQLIRTVAAYGEIAALARLAKQSGINLNEISQSDFLK